MGTRRALLQVLEDRPNSNKPKRGEQFQVEAQFNPQTLQITYHTTGTTGSNAITKQTNATGAPKQQTGNLADLSVDLLFDTSEGGEDVRNTTLKIAAMIRPNVQNKNKKTAPSTPRVLFWWGTFAFYGQIQSVSETLDFFSESGVPLRSTVKLTMTEEPSDRINVGAVSGLGGSASAGIGFSASAGFSAGANAGFSAGASLSAGIDIGIAPLTLAQAGDSLQGIAARAGADVSWKVIAAANNIDNPRMIPPGTPLNLHVSASADASGGIGGSISG
ncbi:MAG TPA: LysM peptidoglycan-binding domain-containing protein [Ktedonobacteraceae bacterium]